MRQAIPEPVKSSAIDSLPRQVSIRFLNARCAPRGSPDSQAVKRA